MPSLANWGSGLNVYKHVLGLNCHLYSQCVTAECDTYFIISPSTIQLFPVVIHDVTVERVQEASQPLGGSFILRVKGNSYDGETTPLPYDASVDEVSFYT